MKLEIKQHIIGICFLLAFILPHVGLLLFVNPVLVLICAYFFFDKKQVTKIQYFFCIVIFLSFILNINEAFSIKAVARASIIILLFLFFPFIKDIRIKNIYLYIITFYVILSQIAYLIDFSPAISFYETYYPYEGEQSLYSSDYLSTITVEELFLRRLGGLFHNSNQCARYLCALLIVFLLENRKQKIKFLLPYIIIVFGAIFITGSRTGFFTGIGVFFYYLYYTQSFLRRFRVVIIPIALICLLGIYGLGSEYFRSFDIESGLSNSVGVKWEQFVKYMDSQGSVLKLFFGIFNIEIWVSQNGIFDSEYGTLICHYGLIGGLSLILFYITLFKRTEPLDKAVFVILLWVVSSTVIFSFRMSFIFMFLLSKYTQTKKYT